MKKILLGAAATALLMTGCSQNELLDGGVATPNDGKIYFSATSGILTRAAAGNPINSTGDLQKLTAGFFVSGYVPGATDPYVDNVNPKFNGVSWEYSPEPYWPNSTMNFFAHANWGTAPTTASTGITATGISIPATGKEDYKQKDLLVAATLGATKEIRTLLTFKHALTQIVFKAGNVNPTKVTASINSVSIANVGSIGDMTYSDPAIGVKWAKPATSTPATDIEGNGATLTAAVKRDTYEVSGISTFNVPSVTSNDYTTYPRIQNDAEPNNNALMLLPQDFKAWVPNANGTAVKAEAQTGSYIKLTGLLYNPAYIDDAKVSAATTGDDAAKEALRAYIFCGTYTGTETTVAELTPGSIYIPISSLPNEIGQWVPGKRINYIITFGDSNDGSGGGGFNEDGDPILVPIRFRATVEDWVETNVPLLTASFDAKSSAITNNFITGYINQLLNDVKVAAAPKVYKGNIKISGTVSNDFGTAPDLTNLDSHTLSTALNTNEPISSKFRPGSTITYDLTGITSWNGKNTSFTVPTGWEARSFKANGDPSQPAATTDAAIAAGEKIDLGATSTANKLVLTKVPTTGYDYNTHIGYIEDNIASIEFNENHVTPSAFTRKVTANGVIPGTTTASATAPYYFNFSCEMLSMFVADAYKNATVTLDLTKVTGWSDATGVERGVRTWCPAGWSASDGTKTYFGGDPIMLTAEGTITFTKVQDIMNHSYLGLSSLDLWLTNDIMKTAGATFYYNNVDFDVEIDVNASPWKDIVKTAVNTNVIVQLKYPLSTIKVKNAETTATSDKWSYHTSGALTFTK